MSDDYLDKLTVGPPSCSQLPERLLNLPEPLGRHHCFEAMAVATTAERHRVRAYFQAVQRKVERVKLVFELLDRSPCPTLRSAPCPQVIDVDMMADLSSRVSNQSDHHGSAPVRDGWSMTQRWSE